jgi:hypothetical protein
MFIGADQFHAFKLRMANLNLLFHEFLNGLPPFLALGVFISQGLILHFE